MLKRLSQSQKTDALSRLLREKGVSYNPTRFGWQKVSCWGASHIHGDRNPSASVNMGTGHYRCFGCDLSGDAIDIVMAEEGLDFKQALARLALKPGEKREEDTWI